MMLFLLVMLAAAGGPKYRECQIAGGQVFRCEGTGYTGEAVAERVMRLKRCKIASGQVVTCYESFTGTVVLDYEGKYRECHISGGLVFRCEGTGYNGEAVVRR